MDDCIGAVIAVDCGPEGYFQGKLAKIEIDDESRGIILSNAFREGVPCGRMLRLDSTKIVQVKVLRTADSVSATPQEPSEASKKQFRNPATPPKNHTMPKQPNGIIHLTQVKEKKLSWDSRSNGGVKKTESTSSERDSSAENEPKIIKKKSNRYKEVQATAVQTIESTPTPLFKRYEPQVPKPQSLTVPAWAVKSAKRGMGPCGIPILDVQNGYGPIARRNAHLDKAIDFEELATDFDFDTNLNLFDKDNVEGDDEEFYESVEKPKMSQNFKHDENILSDPTRVTSWTTTTAKNGYSAEDMPSSSNSFLSVSAPSNISFSPKSFEKLHNGHTVPSLDSSTKLKYLEACQSYLSVTTYSSIATDRIISYFCEIVKNGSFPSSLIVVVLTDASTSEIASFLSSRLGDRGHKIHVFNEANNPNKRKSSNPSHLPSNPHFIISLLNETPIGLLSYLQANANSHVLSLESRPPLSDYSKMHILMLGVFTAGLPVGPGALTVGKTTFAALCGAAATTTPIDCRVAEIGVPFAWIIDGGSEALSIAFSTNLLVQP